MSNINIFEIHKISKTNIVLGALLVIAIVFSVIQYLKASAPVPGHLLSNVDFNQTTESASTTLLITETVVFANAAGAPITLYLPSATATTPHVTFYIKKIDAALANPVTITSTSSQTIDGFSSITLSNRGESIILQSDGSNWDVLWRRSYEISSYRSKGSTLNQWYTSPNTGTALVTGAPAANYLWVVPFITSKPTTIDQMAVYVSASSTGIIRVGIYNDNGNLYPGTLLVDAGTSTGALIGTKTFTTNLPIDIDPGLYWLTYLTSATAPTINGFAVGSMRTVLGRSSALGNPSSFGWDVSFAFAALPNPFPAGGVLYTAIPIPVIYVRTSQ